MKNKILLFVALVSLLICSFVLVVNADVAEGYDFLDPDLVPTKTHIQIKADEIVEFNDGFRCLSAYVFNDRTDVPKNSSFESVMNFKTINDMLGKTEENAYTYADVKGFDLPSGYTFVGVYAGSDAKAPSWVTFPNTITSFDGAIFQNSTTLEECTFKFTEDNPLRKFPGYMFYRCTKLKAFSMPDCFTEIADVVNFYNCSSMTAVYLSKNLTTWYTSGGGSGATFDNCNNMYFVNEPFTYDNIPEKPEVYYFPEGLTSNAAASNDFSNQSTMRNCGSINSILVFGEKVTNFNNAYFFQGTTVKVVFLGDMVAAAMGNGNWYKATYYFANSADKSTDNVTISTYSESKAVFCHAENNTTHLYAINVAPTCTENGYNNYKCFCETVNSQATEIPALGHTKGDFVEIKYENGYLNNGHEHYKCTACDVESYTTEAFIVAPIFVNNGYSYSGTAFLQGFAVNLEALGAYEATGKTVQYGLAVASVAKLGATNTLFDGTTLKAGAFSVSFDDKKQYSIFEMQVTGLVDDYKDAELFVCAYVIEGDTVTYISNGANTTTVEAVTYNQIVASAEANQTTDIIVKKEENV